MKKYRVAFYYNTDCRMDHNIEAKNPYQAIRLAINIDPHSYKNWCDNEDFYIIVERVF